MCVSLVLFALLLFLESKRLRHVHAVMEQKNGAIAPSIFSVRMKNCFMWVLIYDMALETSPVTGK